MHYAFYAEVNQGVITCLFTLETLYLTAASYFCHGEKLCIRQFVGMALLVLCVVALGLSDLISTKDQHPALRS